MPAFLARQDTQAAPGHMASDYHHPGGNHALAFSALTWSRERPVVAVASGAVNGRVRRAVDLVEGGGVVHVAFLYGVCVGNTGEIVDQMFGKVKHE